MKNIVVPLFRAILILGGFWGVPNLYAQQAPIGMSFEGSNATDNGRRSAGLGEPEFRGERFDDRQLVPRGFPGAAKLQSDQNVTSSLQDKQTIVQERLKVLPERPISAFQRFVQETTGRLFPVFGEGVLQKSVDMSDLNAPVSADYEIGAGDELLVSIWGAVDVSMVCVVDRNGQITIPSVGTFPVLGVKARDLDSYLSGQVGRYFRNFKLSASMGKLGGINVYVAGHALVPGMHRVSSTSTLASVLFGIGQPGANGSFRNVQLRRGSQVVASFDLYDFLRDGRLLGDRKLQTGDVVFVGAAGPRVALNVPGDAAAIFEVKPGETLEGILSLSGVDQTLLRKEYVLIEGGGRGPQESARAVERLAYSSALRSAKLRDGDMITLFQNRRDYVNEVTLKGNVAEPARYPHYVGMRISDLIPNTDMLISPGYYQRKGALVGFDRDLSDKAIANDSRLYRTLSIQEQARLRERVRENTQVGIDTAVTAIGPNDVNAGQLSRSSNQKIDAVDDTIRNLLTPINWDYAAIERLERNELKPVLVPFNLRKAMAKDPAHDHVLQPGDVVTIFSAEDADIPKARKTALIKVTGEVLAPGYYQIVTGETLRDVLVKAGGLTENAYLYGTRLVRRSILQQQQEQFQKALDQAERLLFSSANKNIAGAINPAEAASRQTQAVQQKAYLERLRSTKPDGRVVVNVGPVAKRIAELPPLILEDGDSITVPSMPGQIGVYGSVYTQGAFAYQGGKSVFDYLAMAGGAAKGSDKGSIFVLRANGTVESAQQGWIPFVSGLFGEKALPGDVIYVPEDFERVSFLKGLLDFSQIFYQVGLGAAAVNALKK